MKRTSETAAIKAMRRIGARVAVVAGILGIVYFAIQGGEYGTYDLVSQRSRKATLNREIDSLRRTVDSLVKLKHAVETDPRVQERIAREEFGMVRGSKEMLYRFTDSTRK